MNKPNLSSIVKDVRTSMVKHSPEILTGIGIAGMVATTVLAVKATPKALTLLKMKAEAENCNPSDLKPIEKVKTCWKCYIPSVVTGGMSVACLIGASSVSARRNAALAAAYSLSDTALREYREKVVKTIGEKKEQTVMDKISEDKIKKNPIVNNEVIITEKGNTLCYDPLSGRYFKSDIEKIKKAQNDLNKSILSDAFNAGVSLTDFYDEIGLTRTLNSDDLGWNLDVGLIDIYLSAQMAEEDTPYEGMPCLVLNYKNPPKYGF